MRSLVRRAALSAALTILMGASASGQVVVTSTFGVGDSYDSANGWTTDPTQSIAQSFVYLGGSGFQLTTIRLALFSNTGLYSIDFLTGAGPTASPLASWTLSGFGGGIASLTSAPGVLFNSGSTYWIRVASDGDGAWALNDQGIVGMSYQSPPDPAWTDLQGASDYSAAYDVIADVVPVPEPFAQYLLGLSLVGLVGVRRRALFRRFSQGRVGSLAGKKVGADVRPAVLRTEPPR